MDKAQILLHQTGVVVVRRITQVALQPYNRQLDHRHPPPIFADPALALLPNGAVSLHAVRRLGISR